MNDILLFWGMQAGPSSLGTSLPLDTLAQRGESASLLSVFNQGPAPACVALSAVDDPQPATFGSGAILPGQSLVLEIGSNGIIAAVAGPEGSLNAFTNLGVCIGN
jgi:hypothetical protein